MNLGARLKHITPAVLAGVLAVVLMYSAVAGLTTISRDVVSGSDAKQHLDYIWRLYHGSIPKRSEGLQYPAFLEMYNYVPKPQSASANPPLFYVIHAPFVGPLLDAGEYRKAASVGKAINIMLGIGGILSLAYAGWVFGGNKRELMAVSVPAIGAMFYWYSLVNLVYGGIDTLLMIFATMAMILMYKLIRTGPKPKYIIGLTVVSILGMLTKAPYIVFFALSILSLTYSLAKSLTMQTPKKVLIKRAGIVAAVISVTLVASGWFYYLWNYTAHGSWFTAREPGYTGGRVVKSFSDVILSSDLWSLWVSHYSPSKALSVSLVVAAALGVFVYNTKHIFTWLRNRDNAMVAAILVLSLLGVFATQIEHAVGVGEYYFRYLLPACFSFSLLIAYGLSRYSFLKCQMVAISSILLGTSTILGRSGGSYDKLAHLAEMRGLPENTPGLLIIIFLIGSIALACSLYIVSQRATNKVSKDNPSRH